MRRSASRIHAGGVVRASAIRAAQRAELALLGACQSRPARRRDVAVGERERGLGDGSRSLRTDPRERHDPVARVRRAVDGHPASPLAVVRAEAADPSHEPIHGERPLLGRDFGTEADEGMAARAALAVPGPAPPDGHLDLHHRLQPVDVRPLEQTDLDDAHGPRRIALWLSRLAPAGLRCLLRSALTQEPSGRWLAGASPRTSGGGALAFGPRRRLASERHARRTQLRT